jgi:hypothetical protein
MSAVVVGEAVEVEDAVPGEECAEDDSGDVACRALIQGVAIGGLTGALSGALILLCPHAQPGIGLFGNLSSRAAGALALAIPGLIVGSLVGLGCALVPAIVLSTCRRFFRRRVPAARMCAISVTVLLEFQVAATTVCDGYWPGFLVLCIPGAIGIALAAASMPYVLTGEGFRVGPPYRDRPAAG